MTIKCSVYLIHKEYGHVDMAQASEEYVKFFNSKPKFCDAGDDPSFYCANKYKSNVTWGVCRHNVRQGLEPGDEIHFVACYKESNKIWKYYYTGYGIIRDAVSHKDIHQYDKYKVFRKYFNNLIRAGESGLEYHEVLPYRFSHCDDWQMRVASVKRWKDLEAFQKKISSAGCGSNKEKPRKYCREANS